MSILTAAGNVRIAGIAQNGLAGALTSGSGDSGGGGGGGGGLPAWVPPFNTHGIAYAGSTLNTINPDPGGTQGYEAHGTYASMLEAWSSGIYSPYYSTLGCLGFANGGDNDYFGNQFNVFELDGPNALKWRNNIPSFPNSTSNYPSLVTGQQGPTDLFGKMLWSDGSPAIPHTYGALVLLPPAYGGGPKGSALYPVRSFAFLQNNSAWAYRYDLSDGLWHQASTNACPNNGHESCWAWDSNRNVAVGCEVTSNDQSQLLIWTPDGAGSGTHSAKAVPSFELDQDPTSLYLENIDAFIVMGRINNGSWGLYAFDRGSNDAQHTLNVTGDALPGTPGVGLVWVPDFGVRGAIFIISSLPTDKAFIWRVTPPGSSWQTSAWTSTKITVVSNAGGVQGVTTNGTFNRAQYVPPTGCILWVANIGGPTNVYNVVDKSTGLSARTGGLTQTLGAATSVGFGANGSNIVTYSATLVPWNDSFSQLAASKHACAIVMGDNNAYLFPKDMPPVSFPAEIGGGQDGDQSMLRFLLSQNKLDIVHPYWIPDTTGTVVQANNPDDAFCIRRVDPLTGIEWLYYFFSVTTVNPDPPGMHTPPPGQWATPIPQETYIARYRPPFAGGNPTYGTWEIAFNQPGGRGIKSDRAWRGYWDPLYDEFVIPVNCGGQTGFLILDGATGEDKTDFESPGLPWSFGQFTGYSNGVAVDWATRTIWMFDNLAINLGFVSMDAIHNHDRTQAFPHPVVTLDASLRGTVPDQYGGKICWSTKIDGVVFPLHETWYTYRPHVASGNSQSFPRIDGAFSPYSGNWYSSYDTFEDPATLDIITYDWIEFASPPAPDARTHIPGWFRNHFNLS